LNLLLAVVIASFLAKSTHSARKESYRLAADESRLLNHSYIGTEHLLLGLIREGEGIASGVLQSMGVELDQVRKETIRLLKRAMRCSGGQWKRI